MEIDDPTLQRLRQLLAPDFARSVNLAAVAAAKLYQPVSANIGKKVYEDGALVANPILASGSSVVTSTGVTGLYSISFSPVVFAVAPKVVVWSSLESGGNFTVINLQAITTALFQFWIGIASPAGAITAGHTTTVEWIAVGS